MISRTQAEAGTSSLLARTLFCTLVLLGICASSTVLFWGIQPGGWLITFLFLLMMGSVFSVVFMSKGDNPLTILVACFLAFLIGVLLAGSLPLYVEKLGVSVVVSTGGLTLGIVAATGLIASLISIPYRRLEGPLLVILFGLVIYGLVASVGGYFTADSFRWYSIAGSILFVVYLLVDFARLQAAAKHEGSGWGLATLFAVDFFLDIVNLFQFLLGSQRND